jgi:hypothetical protein
MNSEPIGWPQSSQRLAGTDRQLIHSGVKFAAFNDAQFVQNEQRIIRQDG